MRRWLLPITILLAQSEYALCTGPLTSSDIWRIQRGWAARDATQRERWAANGYGPNGEKLASNSVAPSSAASASEQNSLETYLAAVKDRIDLEKSELPALIQKAQYASDLVDLLNEYPYGFLNPEMQRMRQAKMDQLFTTHRIMPVGVNQQDVSAKEAKAFAQVNDLASQVKAAEGQLQSMRSAMANRSARRPPNDPFQQSMPSTVFAGWDANGQPITGNHTGGGNYFMGWNQNGQPINRQAQDIGRGNYFLGFDENGQPITAR